jgi:hypothetical protein
MDSSSRSPEAEKKLHAVAEARDVAAIRALADVDVPPGCAEPLSASPYGTNPFSSDPLKKGCV